MIDTDCKYISIKEQCKILSVNRSTFYYAPKPENSYTLDIMAKIDELYIKKTYLASRGMTRHLRRSVFAVNRKKVRRLMQKMGISAIYRKPNTSVANSEHKVYPYLLNDIEITRPNQVWCSDITYISMKKGFLYLVAIMD